MASWGVICRSILDPNSALAVPLLGRLESLPYPLSDLVPYLVKLPVPQGTPELMFQTSTLPIHDLYVLELPLMKQSNVRGERVLGLTHRLG